MPEQLSGAHFNPTLLGHGPHSHTPPMSEREKWLADYIVGRVISQLDQRQAERDVVAAAALVDTFSSSLESLVASSDQF